VAVTLSDQTRKLLDGRNLAVVATLNPGGQPQATVVWATRDADDNVVFSTTRERQKGINLARDPRLSIVVIDAQDEYNYAEIRGRAEIIDDPDNTLGNELAQHYLGEKMPPEGDWVHRIIVRVVPEKVTGPAS
jgi:PPOX class probable F420-dependent enzyme